MIIGPNIIGIIIIIGSLFLLLPCESMIREYKQLNTNGSYILYSSFEMLTVNDSWAGKTPSSITFNLTVNASTKLGKGRLQAFVFSENFRYIVNYLIELMEERTICPDLRSGLDLMPVLSSIDINKIHYYNFEFEGPDSVNTFNITDKIYIPFSSRYYILLYGCKERYTSVSFSTNGTVEWVNPYGHLRGSTYGTILVQLLKLILFGLVLIVWLFLLFLFKQNVHIYQKSLTLVLVLGFLSSVLQFLHYSYVNNNGKERISTKFISSLFEALYITSLRGIYLMMTTGYLITTTRINRKTIALRIILVISIFIKTFSSNYFDLIRNMSHPFISVVYLVPVMIIEGFYFLSAYYSISVVMTGLETYRDQFKTNLFTKLRKTLIIIAFLVVIISILYLKVLEYSQHPLWPIRWVVEAYWDFIFIGGLLALLIFFRIRKNNRVFSVNSVTFVNQMNFDIIEPLDNSSNSKKTL